jgi:hypothetical protein
MGTILIKHAPHADSFDISKLKTAYLEQLRADLMTDLRTRGEEINQLLANRDENIEAIKILTRAMNDLQENLQVVDGELENRFRADDKAVDGTDLEIGSR